MKTRIESEGFSIICSSSPTPYLLDILSTPRFPPFMFSAQHFIDQSHHYLVEDYPGRIKLCLESLTHEQIWWRPNEASNSIGNLILHLIGNTGQWIQAGIGKTDYQRHRDLEFNAQSEATKDEFLDLLLQSLEANSKVLKDLSPTLLEDEVTIQGFTVTKRLALYHAVEHYAMHTGQIIYITKLQTATSLGFYSIGKDSAKPRWKDTGI